MTKYIRTFKYNYDWVIITNILVLSPMVIILVLSSSTQMLAKATNESSYKDGFKNGFEHRKYRCEHYVR